LSFFFQAEDGIRDFHVTGVQTCALPISDVPFRGVYLFENKTGEEFPVFEAPVKIGEYLRNPQVSFVNGEPKVIDRGYEHVDFRSGAGSYRRLIFPSALLKEDFPKKERFFQYTYVDFDGDGDQDVVVGI